MIERINTYCTEFLFFLDMPYELVCCHTDYTTPLSSTNKCAWLVVYLLIFSIVCDVPMFILTLIKFNLVNDVELGAC